MEILSQAAINLELRLVNECAARATDDQVMIDSAVRDHSTVPEHYWMPRHKADAKLRAVRALLEALSDVRP